MIIEFWFVIIGFIGAIIEFTFFFYNITVDGIDVLDTDAVDENVEDENVENEEDDDEDNNILKYKKKNGFYSIVYKMYCKIFYFYIIIWL